MTETDLYWARFLRETGRGDEEKCAGDLNFESKGVWNDGQIALILAGKKTAFFSSLAAFAADSEMLPVSGELYVVVDRAEIPRCVIELTGVQVVPFGGVTWEMAALEGEDENLEAWRRKERETLEDEGAVIGFRVTPALKLVFQSFRVVYR